MTKMVAYWAVTVLIALETLVGGVADLVHGRSILVAGPPVAIGPRIDTMLGPRPRGLPAHFTSGGGVPGWFGHVPFRDHSGEWRNLADAQDSGSCVRKDVGVQVPPRPRVVGWLSLTMC